MEQQLAKIDRVIGETYPSLTLEEGERLRNRIIEYILQGLTDGYDFALFKEVDDGTILKVLRIFETELDDGGI